MNLRRRHLNASQRAMIAALLANLDEGRPSKTPQIQGVSTEQAAKLLKVGHSSVETAKAVKRDAVPEIIELVDAEGGEGGLETRLLLACWLEPSPPPGAFGIVAINWPSRRSARSRHLRTFGWRAIPRRKSRRG